MWGVLAATRDLENDDLHKNGIYRRKATLQRLDKMIAARSEPVAGRGAA
jgi:hypothetical protein